MHVSRSLAYASGYDAASLYFQIKTPAMHPEKNPPYHGQGDGPHHHCRKRLSQAVFEVGTEVPVDRLAEEVRNNPRHDISRDSANVPKPSSG